MSIVTVIAVIIIAASILNSIILIVAVIVVIFTNRSFGPIARYLSCGEIMRWLFLPLALWPALTAARVYGSGTMPSATQTQAYVANFRWTPHPVIVV